MNTLRNTLLSAVTVIAFAFTAVPLANANEPIIKFDHRQSNEVIFEPLITKPVITISSPKTTEISFAIPEITSTPAPVLVPEPITIVQATTNQIEPIKAPARPVVPPTEPVLPKSAEPLVASVSAPSNVGAALAASAMGQIGIAQDCTRMVENALGSIGIVTGDIGPINFFRYGQVVGDPQPGDLMIQGNAHVAIYVGNGQAVSGGFNGQNTVLHPASYLGGASYVRVG